MNQLIYQRPELISLKEHHEFDEKWVQDRIAEDPTILGLGDLVMKDKERRQPKGGRLDLLLQDVETNHRHEAELTNMRNRRKPKKRYVLSAEGRMLSRSSWRGFAIGRPLLARPS